MNAATHPIDWFEVGRRAFANGEPAAPTLNPHVREAVERLPVGGGGTEIMGEFGRGWHAANLAAPVE